jgi:hypothetical protein
LFSKAFFHVFHGRSVKKWVLSIALAFQIAGLKAAATKANL